MTRHRLRSPRRGTVYLTIPGQKAGAGKVTLCLQNRSVEYQALTPHRMRRRLFDAFVLDLLSFHGVVSRSHETGARLCRI